MLADGGVFLGISLRGGLPALSHWVRMFCGVAGNWLCWPLACVATAARLAETHRTCGMMKPVCDAIDLPAGGLGRAVAYVFLFSLAFLGSGYLGLIGDRLVYRRRVARLAG